MDSSLPTTPCTDGAVNLDFGSGVDRELVDCLAIVDLFYFVGSVEGGRNPVIPTAMGELRGIPSDM